MAGVVLVRPMDNGQVISPETTLFQLGSCDDMELQADVDEAYADALRPGMSARAALSGADAIFVARVTEVSPRVDSTTGGRLIKLSPLVAMNIPPGAICWRVWVYRIGWTFPPRAFLVGKNNESQSRVRL